MDHTSDYILVFKFIWEDQSWTGVWMDKNGDLYETSEYQMDNMNPSTLNSVLFLLRKPRQIEFNEEVLKSP